MSELRVALVVPNGEGRQAIYDRTTLRRWIQDRRVDLVAFPEMFLDAQPRRATLAAAQEITVWSVRSLAEKLGVPVLAGVRCVGMIDGGGMQCAGYWNPEPRAGETVEHFYAKHSTSQVLPYELPDYTRERERMFAPIHLGGRKIGVQLCHDQFFGLISNRLVNAGADVLFDLTGSQVVLSKWENVVAGRSLEHGLPYLCTMARSSPKKGTKNVAVSFGFRDGRRLVPTLTKSGRNGDLTLLHLGAATEGPKAQGTSPTVYDDVTLALHPSPIDANIRVSGAVDAQPQWQTVRVKRKRIGVLTLPAEALRDPLCIHRNESDTAFDVLIACFVSRKNVLSEEEALTLAKLRAIEHRMAIVVCTPSVREVIKASRYKQIQRMKEQAGVFGLDLAFMKGTYASMQATKGLGIPEEYQHMYRKLAEAIR